MTDRAFAAVLFDLDSTLVDSSAAVDRSWRTWAAEHGLTSAELGEHTGLPAHDTVVRALDPGANIAAAVARIEELEVTDTDGVVALPGAADALAAVPADRAAVVTSCSAALAAARLTAAGLAAPEVLVTVDRIARGKPAPDGYLLAARELGADPADCLVVEDATGGIAAARAAGCAVLALTTSTPAEALPADLVVRTLADVRFIVTADGIQLRVDT